MGLSAPRGPHPPPPWLKGRAGGDFGAGVRAEPRSVRRRWGTGLGTFALAAEGGGGGRTAQHAAGRTAGSSAKPAPTTTGGSFRGGGGEQGEQNADAELTVLSGGPPSPQEREMYRGYVYTSYIQYVYIYIHSHTNTHKIYTIYTD